MLVKSNSAIQVTRLDNLLKTEGATETNCLILYSFLPACVVVVSFSTLLHTHVYMYKYKHIHIY